MSKVMACQRRQRILHDNVEQRIKTLLCNTNLTFKQIVEQMKQEQFKATLNDIRRVNKDNQYRKKRYESKLTPQQRISLIEDLMDPNRPNLTVLAEKYGVCHGSIWYWSDKMERIRARNNGNIPLDHPILAGCTIPDALKASIQNRNLCSDYLSGAETEGSGNSVVGNNTASLPDLDDDYCGDVDIMNDSPFEDWMHAKQEEQEEKCFPLNLTAYKDRKPVVESYEYIEQPNNNKCSPVKQDVSLNDLNVVGPVQALDSTGQLVSLPIMMYTNHTTINPIESLLALLYASSTFSLQQKPIDVTTSPNDNSPLCLKKITQPTCK